MRSRPDTGCSTVPSVSTLENLTRSPLIALDRDTDYGNEKGAGAGIKQALDEGIVKREELVIVSKLWNTFHEKERVEPIARQQLEWWGIE